MKRKIISVALSVLCLCALCSCSKSENTTDISQSEPDSTATAAVTTTAATKETSELVADTPPPYMYYDGKIYTSMYKEEKTFMSYDDKISESLIGYECIGNTHECKTINDMLENFDVTSLPDDAKVYYNSDKTDNENPFIIVSELNGQTELLYLNIETQ